MRFHDDVIKWKHFPRYWSFVRGIHRSQRPVTRSFDIFFDLRLNKRLSKQSWGWWFETLTCPLWRQCNVSALINKHPGTLAHGIRLYDEVIKWKHFPRYWPFVRGIRRSPVNSPHKGQWRGALMFLWSVPWMNGSVNNREAGDLRRHRAYYDVIVMTK